LSSNPRVDRSTSQKITTARVSAMIRDVFTRSPGMERGKIALPSTVFDTGSVRSGCRNRVVGTR